MKKIIFTLIHVILLINAYASNNHIDNTNNELVVSETQYEKLIELAKTYFTENTEYAFVCLYKANVIAEENDDLNKMVECNTLMGNIFKENNSIPTAISYYEKVCDDLIKMKEYNAACKMYINIANLYQNIEFESKWSFEAINKAIKCAETSNNKIILTEINLTLGDLNASQYKYDEAIKYYDLVINNEINKNTIHFISKALTNKANIMIQKKKYENAINIIDSSLYLCIRNFNDSLLIKNYSYKAIIYDSIGDYESAKKYYKQSIELAYSTKYFNECGKNMFNLANLYKKNEKYDEAINVLKIICDSTERYKMYDICYQSYYQLSQCYALLYNYEQAYNMFNKYDNYYKSTFTLDQEEKINKLRNSFLLSLSIKELKNKEIENSNKVGKKELWILISIIIVLTLILITYVILYLNYKTMFNKNKETTYEQELKINRIENELMEHQLKNNRESLINFALHLKSYIELINPLKEELRAAIELPEQEQKNKIKTIYHNIQNNIQTINNTDNLNRQIDAVCKNFLDRLNEKYPGLTKSEKKLCTMLVINMSSKEIASLTNTTTRSVETSRYRLRKKFGLSRDEDIIEFLKKI